MSKAEYDAARKAWLQAQRDVEHKTLELRVADAKRMTAWESLQAEAAALTDEERLAVGREQFGE